MDQRIFDSLNMLERGARVETRPRYDAYNNNSAEFSAYDGPELGYDEVGGVSYEQDHRYAQDEFVDQPMTLDSFGEANRTRIMVVQALTEAR